MGKGQSGVGPAVASTAEFYLLCQDAQLNTEQNSQSRSEEDHWQPDPEEQGASYGCHITNRIHTAVSILLLLLLRGPGIIGFGLSPLYYIGSQYSQKGFMGKHDQFLVLREIILLHGYRRITL